MLVSPSYSDTCPECNAVNCVLRKRCRFCGTELTVHPDKEIDREVRLDAEDARRYERKVGLLPPAGEPTT